MNDNLKFFFLQVNVDMMSKRYIKCNNMSLFQFTNLHYSIMGELTAGRHAS